MQKEVDNKMHSVAYRLILFALLSSLFALSLRYCFCALFINFVRRWVIVVFCCC